MTAIQPVVFEKQVQILRAKILKSIKRSMYVSSQIPHSVAFERALDA